MKLLNDILYKNTCDGAYNSIDVHFTNICDNKCTFCIDKNSIIVNNGKPNWRDIYNSIIEHSDGMNDVLILGGEPCLFLDDLYQLVKLLKHNTSLKVYVTTSVPKICYDNKKIFFDLIYLLDGINLSVQHHNELVADRIRGTTSKYDRQSFYNELPYKHNIRLNINLVKNHFSSKQELIRCLTHYDKFWFGSIKISELQHANDQFVSFEKLMNIKLPSPYFNGCQQYIVNTEKYFGMDIETPILLKRSCFVCEKTLKASILDGVKVLYKTLFQKPHKHGYVYNVIYEDGSVQSAWIKNKKENCHVDQINS